jgi:hypothetical protein
MELLTNSILKVTEETFFLQDPEDGVLVYKEWSDESGNVIDFVLRSKDGYEIDDPSILERVQTFVDNLRAESGEITVPVRRTYFLVVGKLS